MVRAKDVGLENSGVGDLTQKRGFGKEVVGLISGVLSKLLGSNEPDGESFGPALSVDAYIKSKKPLYIFTNDAHINRTTSVSCGVGEAIFLTSGKDSTVLMIWFGDFLKRGEPIPISAPHFKIDIATTETFDCMAQVSVPKYPYMVALKIMDAVQNRSQ